MEILLFQVIIGGLGLKITLLMRKIGKSCHKSGFDIRICYRIGKNAVMNIVAK